MNFQKRDIKEKMKITFSAYIQNSHLTITYTNNTPIRKLYILTFTYCCLSFFAYFCNLSTFSRLLALADSG